jgi:hypothetical protein
MTGSSSTKSTVTLSGGSVRLVKRRICRGSAWR